MQYVSDIFTMLSRTASTYICGSGSGVEHHLAKVRVAGSSLVFRSKERHATFFFRLRIYIKAFDTPMAIRFPSVRSAKVCYPPF